VPNPGLDPETANHVEVGFEQRARSWDAKLAIFQSKIKDAIQSVSLPPAACAVSPCSQLQNVGEQRNRGFELTLDYAPIDTLHLGGEYDLVQIDNLNNPAVRYTGSPEDKYRLSADWQFLSQWYLRADAQHESSRFSNSTGTRQTGSFTLLNAFLRFEPGKHFGVEVGVRNATNELYAYEEGFYEPGRTWLAQLDYRL
jgi:iron complex outermembrane recepter protein